MFGKLMALFFGALDVKQAAQNRRKEIIGSDNNPEEIDALAGASWSVRALAFVVFVLPFMVGIIAPSHSANMWAAFDAMPSWYLNLFIAINGAIWGLSELRPLIPSLVRSVKDAVSGRR